VDGRDKPGHDKDGDHGIVRDTLAILHGDTELPRYSGHAADGSRHNIKTIAQDSSSRLMDILPIRRGRDKAATTELGQAGDNTVILMLTKNKIILCWLSP
jgi:hypothetical protein